MSVLSLERSFDPARSVDVFRVNGRMTFTVADDKARRATAPRPITALRTLVLERTTEAMWLSMPGHEH